MKIQAQIAGCTVIGASKFKRIVSLLLSLLMVFTLISGIGFSAYAASYEDYEYTILDDGTAEISKYTGSDTAIVIPALIDNVPVTRIGAMAFIDQSYIVSIKIPNGVTEIGRSAFAYCYRLRNITIPSSVQSIGDYAFRDCECITNIDLPDGLTVISKGMFAGCQNLERAPIPDSVTVIEDSAFEYCDSLLGVKIPSGVKSIGDNAFYNCRQISILLIPEGVATIGARAFDNCTQIVRVILPLSLETIGDSAFLNTNIIDTLYAGSPEQFGNIEIGYYNNKLIWSDICYNIENPEFYMFFDLRGYEKYTEYVLYTSLYNSFINGTNPPYNNVFHPKVSITRAMFVTILYRMAGSPYDNGKNPYKSTPFTDIKDTSVYYYDAACWALDEGVTDQIIFKPNDSVTREQTATMLFRYAQENNMLGDEAYKAVKLSDYHDFASIRSWAKEPMKWANYNGMITGTEQGYANPQDATQRIHATKILYGFGKTCNIGNFE